MRTSAHRAASAGGDVQGPSHGADTGPGRPDGAALQGAEAIVGPASWLGRDVLEKARLAKAYRHPALDRVLRDARTRDEAHLLIAARRAGVRVPLVYDVDRPAAVLRLETIPGPMLRDLLPADDEASALARFGHLGSMVAVLHDAGVTHGDLTTSNVLVPDPADARSLVLIDFGLGRVSEEAEDRAVDLHLMEEALEATDERAKPLTAAFLDAYAGAARHAAITLRRLEAVRERGRYRGAS